MKLIFTTYLFSPPSGATLPITFGAQFTSLSSTGGLSLYGRVNYQFFPIPTYTQIWHEIHMGPSRGPALLPRLSLIIIIIKLYLLHFEIFLKKEGYYLKAGSSAIGKITAYSKMIGYSCQMQT